MATATLPTTTPSVHHVAQQRWGTMSVLVACVVFITGVRGYTYHEPVRGDQSVYAVIGHELLKGRRLYSDLWDHKPPAIHVIYAIAELVAGYGPHQVYLLNVAALTCILLGLYRAGTLLGGTRAGLCTAVFWALCSVFPNWQGYQPNTEVFVNACLVWSYCLICRLGSAPAWWRALAFGAIIGIASLFKPVAVVPAFLLGLVYILGAGRNEGGHWLALRHMFVAAAVSILAWVACFAWFWYRGNLQEFYDAVFVYNRHYSGSLARNLVGSLKVGSRS
jgi:4-amino-4-deoxy-L-arabinose transferase-like glycosyltransferase